MNVHVLFLILAFSVASSFAQAPNDTCGTPFGVVRLKIEILASGTVGEITVVKGLPDGLTEQAVAAAKKIKFEPARKDGIPQTKIVTTDYTFQMFFDSDSPELKKKAEILKFPAPKFPKAKPSDGVPSKIGLKVELKSDGTVEINEVLTSAPPKFIDAAKKAALSIKFKPAVHRCGSEVIQITKIEFAVR